MRRITVEEVLEAYRVTGLKPVRRFTLLRADGAACAIGAIAIASGCDKSIDSIADWRNSTFRARYSGGFMNGFDDAEREKLTIDEYNQGYADGQAVAAAVFQEQGAK